RRAVTLVGAPVPSWRWASHLPRQPARRFLNGSSRGSFNFVSFPDFAAGLVNSATFRSGSTLAYWRRYPWDFFWQDQFKVKQNLPLSYRIRYENPSAMVEIRDPATHFVPGVGPVVFGTNQVLDVDPTKQGPASIFYHQAPFTLSSSGVHKDKNNFAPVMGFGYSPRFAKSVFGRDATVTRWVNLTS